jgi:hypothetical protein
MMDLLWETRAPLLSAHSLFFDLQRELPRTLRRLCTDAMKQINVHEDALIFGFGDACSRMFFICSGFVHYEWKKRHSRKHRSSVNSEVGKAMTTTMLDHVFSKRDSDGPPECTSSQDSRRWMPRLSETGGSSTQASYAPSTVILGQKLEHREWLSEPALWIEWENKGTLTAGTVSSLLAIEVQDFIGVAGLFREARLRMVLYARAFMDLLHLCPDLNDVMDSAVEYMKWQEDNEEYGWFSEATSINTGLGTSTGFAHDDDDDERRFASVNA